MTVFDWPARLTVTFSPGVAQPQTGRLRSHWRTMWSPNTLGSFTSAAATATREPRIAIVPKTFTNDFMHITVAP